VYERTRKRISSSVNPYFFKGLSFSGFGSPHTPHNYIWPLATMVEVGGLPTTGQASACRHTASLCVVGVGVVVSRR
jgi:uncharacterized protein